MELGRTKAKKNKIKWSCILDNSNKMCAWEECIMNYKLLPFLFYLKGNCVDGA